MNTKSIPPELHTELQLLRSKIGAHAFFKGLRSEHLATMAIYAMQTDFAPGQMILKQGDLANRFYIILEGKVALETRKDDGTPVLVQTLGAGDVLGWSWLFAPYIWRFDARALEPGKAIFFYGTRLREHCEEDPRFGYELMERVAQVAIDRLQALRERLLELSGVRRT